VGLRVSAFSQRDPAARGLGMTSQRARDRLVERLAAEGIRDRRVLDVMRQLPRHLFIDEALVEAALPRRVLEIGTGSGYQCAVLAQLVEEVYTIERIDELLRNARRRLRKLAIGNVRSRHDDGRLGWPEQAPFDAILLTAAGTQLEQALLAQLAPGGCLVAPVGPPGRQALLRIRAGEDGWQSESLGLVSFVPLLGGTG
jgi:protein-L-isoaspartate(D-aspartate) O-methyltransferase